MSSYKLHYFNGRGRAEVSRLIFAAAGQKYEDLRIEREQWPTKKAETPLGQVPVLEYDGVKLPQSISIARFLAKQFQLAGKDNFEQAKVDAVADTIGDLFSAYLPSRREQDETKKQELVKKFLSEDAPKQLQNLEVLAKLYGNGDAFFVGGHLTWVDLYFYDLIQTLLEIDSNALAKFSLLQKIRAEVDKHPKIAEYVKNRPKTSF